MKNFRSILYGIVLFALLSSTMVPSMTSFTPTTAKFNTSNSVVDTSSVQRTVNSLEAQEVEIPKSNVEVNHANTSADITLWYDSIVEINDSYVAGNPQNTFLYNNSMLIFNNVTFTGDMQIHVQNNASLFILNSKGTTNINIFVTDLAHLYLRHSNLTNVLINVLDNATTHMSDTHFRYIYSRGNATISAYNSTGMRVTADENAHISASNTTFTQSVYVHTLSTADFCNITTYQIILTDNGTAVLKNSTVNYISLYSGFSSITVINSTIVYTMRSYSGSISHVYNSTIRKLYHGFILNGSAISTEENYLSQITGTWNYNILNDTATTAEFIYNVTNFYVFNGSMEFCNWTTVTIYLVQVINSSVEFYSGTVTTLSLFDNSSADLNNTHITSVNAYRSSITGYNQSYIGNLNLYNNSMVNVTSSVVRYIFSLDSRIILYNITEQISEFSVTNSFVNCNLITTRGISMSHNSVGYFSNVVIADNLYLVFNSTAVVRNSMLNESAPTILFESTLLGDILNLSISTFTVLDSLINLTNAEVENTIVQANASTVLISDSDCNGCVYGLMVDANNSSISLYNVTASSVTLFNSSTANISENSIISSITVQSENNISSVYIHDSNITQLDVQAWNARAEAINSTVYSVDYAINITGGFVNLTGNHISGDAANYLTTFKHDANTNVTNCVLSRLHIYSSTTYLSNLSVANEILVENAELHVVNVTMKKLFYNGPNLEVKNSVAQYEIYALNTHSPIDVDIDNVTAMGIYIGAGADIGDNVVIGGIVSGNVTSCNVTWLIVYSGEVGISDCNAKIFLSGPFATIYLYNSSIKALYNSYTFTHDGTAYIYNVTGYSSSGVVNVTGNTIDSMRIGYLVNYNGTLQGNSVKEALYIGYNTSKGVFTNESSISGFSLYDSAVLYLNDSKTEFMPLIGNDLWDHSTAYIKNSTLKRIQLHENSFADMYNTTLGSYLDSAGVYTIEIYDFAVLNINYSYLYASTAGGVLVQDNGRLNANNLNGTINSMTYDGVVSTQYGALFKDDAVVYWNNSELYFNNIPDAVTLIHNSKVYMENLKIYGDGTQSIQVIFSLYNDSTFTGVSFNMPDTCLGTATLEAYDLSAVTLTSSFVEHVFVTNNSATTFYDSQTKTIYVQENASFELLNKNYNSFVVTYVDVRGTASHTTLTNVSIREIYAAESAYLSLIDVSNSSGLTISVSNYALLFAENLTANELYLYFESGARSTAKSTLNDTAVGKLLVSITVYKTCKATINETSQVGTPSSMLLHHVIQNNVSYDSIEFSLTILDSATVNASNLVVDVLFVSIVFDLTPPTISVTPSSLAFEKGLKDKLLSFVLVEDLPDYYILKKNDSVVDEGAYENGTTILVDVSNNSAGVWVYTLTANDTAGNTETKAATVTVYPSEPPVFTAKPPRVYNMTENTTGNVLSWTATDKTPTYYEIYVNGTLKTNATWTSETSISYAIDDLISGTYNITILLHDGVGNVAVDSVTVIVTPPPSAEGPSMLYVAIAAVAVVAVVILVYLIKTKKIVLKR